MASWNRPRELLASCDLVLLARGAEAICFGREPHELLAALACLRVSVALPVVYGGETLFGAALGSFANAAAAPSVVASGSALYMLPPLDGDDEGLSSTTLRETVIARLEESPHLHSHPHLSLPPTLSLLPLPPTTRCSPMLRRSPPLASALKKPLSRQQRASSCTATQALRCGRSLLASRRALRRSRRWAGPRERAASW